MAKCWWSFTTAQPQLLAKSSSLSIKWNNVETHCGTIVQALKSPVSRPPDLVFELKLSYLNVLSVVLVGGWSNSAVSPAQLLCILRKLQMLPFCNTLVTCFFFSAEIWSPLTSPTTSFSWFHPTYQDLWSIYFWLETTSRGYLVGRKFKYGADQIDISRSTPSADLIGILSIDVQVKLDEKRATVQLISAVTATEVLNLPPGLKGNRRNLEVLILLNLTDCWSSLWKIWSCWLFSCCLWIC